LVGSGGGEVRVVEAALLFVRVVDEGDSVRIIVGIWFEAADCACTDHGGLETRRREDEEFCGG
jgi:hypothetical protein